MIVVRHVCAAALPVLVCLCQPLSVAAQGEGGAMTASGAPDARAGRIDRTVVSPFRGARRIVVQPGPNGGSVVVAVGAAFGTPAAASALVPATAASAPPAPSPGAFIDIGPLDAASAPPPPAPAGRVEYLDTGPYPDDTFLPTPSSFPPD